MIQINMKATGELLHNLCKNAGYKPKDISILFNTDVTTPYYWFNGKVMPSWTTMVNLSRLLNVKIDDMIVVDEDADENE